MSHIRVSKQNLIDNIKNISKRCKIDKFAAVLKDNAYGHGLVECANICKEAGVRHAIVRDNSEADQISDLFETIIVLSDCTTPKRSNIHITINTISAIQRLDANTKIELKIDTGMHRNGISEHEIDEAFEKIIEKKLLLSGVMSHLRSSDELSTELFWQEKNFLRCIDKVNLLCEKFNLPTPRFHLHNSAGTLRCADFSKYDLARVGIAMYGYMDMSTAFNICKLKPVMSLHADKISSRTSYSKWQLGYGGKGKLETSEITSIYDIGYADGFFRLNENHNYILPNGSKVIGRVSMDSMIINSTDDSIVIFDDARELAKINNTITYDILVKLSNKIPRIIC